MLPTSVQAEVDAVAGLGVPLERRVPHAAGLAEIDGLGLLTFFFGDLRLRLAGHVRGHQAVQILAGVDQLGHPRRQLQLRTARLGPSVASSTVL